MPDKINAYKNKQELCFRTEKVFMEKFSNLIEECRLEELDLGTILSLLLNQSLTLIFRFAHSEDEAVEIIEKNLDKLLDALLKESESKDYEDLELIQTTTKNSFH